MSMGMTNPDEGAWLSLEFAVRDLLHSGESRESIIEVTEQFIDEYGGEPKRRRSHQC